MIDPCADLGPNRLEPSIGSERALTRSLELGHWTRWGGREKFEIARERVGRHWTPRGRTGFEPLEAADPKRRTRSPPDTGRGGVCVSFSKTPDEVGGRRAEPRRIDRRRYSGVG
ncbi:hypothetical protein C492_21752 [Natronococcus jeotgali DSM 18795]|uniref:Uncharacterized protein n=1 Tax=Natronococcus jeotgali DSM 18795 TaxID=1227498 RepID=L9WNP2_9EURY|nr:hypothetical protein C492_21752 [Natronococcus jeotgali DSM 18795]